MRKLRKALFFIEPDFISSAILETWLNQGHGVVKIYTADERKLKTKFQQRLKALIAGRQTLHALATKHSIPIQQIGEDKNPLFHDVLAQEADTLFTVMSHFIVPSILLEKFGAYAINFHPALLPDYKGARPTGSMLMDGVADDVGGVTAHILTDDIDCGPIIAKRSVPCSPNRSLVTWSYLQALAAIQIMQLGVLPYLNGSLEAVPQVEGSGHYRKSSAWEFQVTSDKSLAEVSLLFERLKMLTLRAQHETGEAHRLSYRVFGIDKVLGAPTGGAPVIGTLYSEMDLADARVRLKRRSIFKSTIGHPICALLGFRLRQLANKSTP